ncbi:alpha/beta fold hydrolase [Paenibacillus koleovorans]|uniref:alpha/beta fold hydrolase n=1 Tax=Paenibacillus koleovorans TaxID=121608 RepID=UPI000FDB6C94|nr:alpha/beta hydrolase [Paenibacillus koleovorans]
MSTVISKDGTTIAYETVGQGPAVIFVDGALNSRSMSLAMPIAKRMAGSFTGYLYDRRGRGESGNTLPWSLDREIEDLEALIDAAGGSAYVLGLSSGALLALEATEKLAPGKVKKLALYEAPMILDNSRAPLGEPALQQVKQYIVADRRGDAMSFFMRAVEVPGFMLMLMKLSPMWKKVSKVAHTLVYDFEIATPYQAGKPLPANHWSAVTIPTWVGVGSKSHAWMINAQKALAEMLPNATLHTLPKQTHIVKPAAIQPELERFLMG